MDKVEDGHSRDIETLVDEARLYASKAAPYIRDGKWQSAAIILLERCKIWHDNKALYARLTAEITSLRSELARKEKALRSAYTFIDDHVEYTFGDHENPPEPRDSFSYGAGSCQAMIKHVLGEDHDYIIQRAAITGGVEILNDDSEVQS